MKYQPDELFRSTAPYYARYRPGYPREFFTYLRERFGLDGTQRALDLGCGPGQIAVPLSADVREVIAVDPEPTMLDEGRTLAAERGITNIHWRVGDSYQLPTMGLDQLDLVTMGASFHWMDRPEVLRTLDRMIVANGAVVVASGGPAGASAPPPWEDVVTEVRATWLGPERRAGSGTYTHPEQRHEEVLRHSPFGHVEVVSWTWELERTLDQVVGLQFSYSYSAPALLGDNKDAYEADLRRALTATNPSGRYIQVIRTEAIIATRPG
ncbi:class I SAM-dependent methyltransferase [Planosporangium sp. 12N6]|uniref:class I SAM-dependent methyltransferase n=1 Tax=Planosporangium spinosum TaxID=3402278 RepID=UPI003CEDF58A